MPTTSLDQKLQQRDFLIGIDQHYLFESYLKRLPAAAQLVHRAPDPQLLGIPSRMSNNEI
jgi:hypothetical protein